MMGKEDVGADFNELLGRVSGGSLRWRAEIIGYTFPKRFEANMIPHR